jgi:hypothetical protein
MPTLKDIAKQVSALVVNKAPQSRKGSNGKKPGNLKRALRRENTPANVLEEKKDGSFSFTINYAPPGADYGRWWNDPTVSDTVRNQKTGNDASINFAEKAINSPIVDSLVQDYLDEISNQVASKIQKAIDDLD